MTARRVVQVVVTCDERVAAVRQARQCGERTSEGLALFAIDETRGVFWARPDRPVEIARRLLEGVVEG